MIGVSALVITLIDAAAAFAWALFIARTQPTAAFASWAFTNAILGALAFLVFFGVAEVSCRELAKGPSKAASQLVSATLQIGVLGSAGAGLLALLYAVVFAGHDVTLVLASIFSLMANTAAAALNHAVQAFGEQRRDLARVAISRGLGLGFGVFVLWNHGIVAGVCAYASGAIALAVARARMLRLRLGFAPVSLIRDLLQRGRMLGVSGAFGSVAARADAIFLERLASVLEQARYSAAYRAYNALALAPIALASAFGPRLATGQISRRHFFAIALLPIGAALGVGVTAPFWAALVFGTSFPDVGRLISVLSLAAALASANVFISKALIASGDYSAAAKRQVISAAVNVVANIALIPAFGAMGAAVAMIVSETVLLLHARRRLDVVIVDASPCMGGAYTSADSLAASLKERGLSVEIWGIANGGRRYGPKALWAQRGAAYFVRELARSTHLLALCFVMRPRVIIGNNAPNPNLAARVASRLFGVAYHQYVRGPFYEGRLSEHVLDAASAVYSVGSQAAEQCRLHSPISVSEGLHEPAALRDADAATWLWAGVDVPWKGLETILKAYTLAAKRRTLPQLVVCRVPHPSCPSGTKIPAGVVVIDDPRELSSIRRKASVFFHAPKVHEPFGRAVLEAMSAGLCPVITKEANDHGLVTEANGFVVADADALAETMVRLVDDPALATARGKQARTTASQCDGRVYDKVAAAIVRDGLLVRA